LIFIVQLLLWWWWWWLVVEFMRVACQDSEREWYRRGRGEGGRAEREWGGKTTLIDPGDLVNVD
jgi:hypothetical protein